MKCPSCDSENVRASRKQSSVLYTMRGMQRYRCRECGKAFYEAIPAATRDSIKQSEQLRRKRARGWSGLVQSRTQRRVVEVVLFVGMLLLFYYVLNSLVTRDGAGIFSHGSSEAP